MYKDINEGISETVEIMGYPFYAEDITSDESFNRREYRRQSLLNGTESVIKGKYISRKFSFSTDVYFKDNKPNEHDEIFKKMMSEPVEVISPYMGGKFTAEVVIQKQYETASPNHMKLNIDIHEIPSEKSNIPGETTITLPEHKDITVSKS